MESKYTLCKIGDLVTFQNGYAFKSSEFILDGNCKVIKIKELKDGKVRFFDDTATIDYKDEYKAFVINKNDILFALTGDPVSKPNPLSWVGRVSVYDNETPALLNQRVCKVICSDKINSYYLYYYFRQQGVFYSLAAKATGSASQANISTKTIADTDILLPCLDEQKKIVSILNALDNKIKLNNEINSNLEQQVLSIYKQTFEKTENIDRTVCRADEYFDISIGKTPPRKEPNWFSTNPDDITWVSISDMGSCGLYISTSSENLTSEAVSKFNVKVVPNNTVILSFKLTVGRVAITNGEMTTNEAIAHFVSDNKAVVEYLYCYLKTFNYQTMGSTSSIATAVNSKIIKGVPFVVPTDAELTAFHDVAEPMFAQIKANQEEIVRLTSIRDTLLPKLMSGEIDLSSVDI